MTYSSTAVHCSLSCIRVLSRFWSLFVPWKLVFCICYIKLSSLNNYSWADRFFTNSMPRNKRRARKFPISQFLFHFFQTSEMTRTKKYVKTFRVVLVHHYLRNHIVSWQCSHFCHILRFLWENFRWQKDAEIFGYMIARIILYNSQNGSREGGIITRESLTRPCLILSCFSDN